MLSEHSACAWQRKHVGGQCYCFCWWRGISFYIVLMLIWTEHVLGVSVPALRVDGQNILLLLVDKTCLGVSVPAFAGGWACCLDVLCYVGTSLC